MIQVSVGENHRIDALRIEGEGLEVELFVEVFETLENLLSE